MTRILVPYHLDEPVPDLDLPAAAGTTVTAELPDGDAWSRMARLYQAVAAGVAESARAGGRPVVLSGDCTTSLATVAGLQRAGLDPAIVWFDAHGDVQTLETTTSGYLGGMPLRMLVGYRPELLAAPLGLHPVGEERVLLVDARDLDAPEVAYLEGAAISRCEVAGLSAGDLPDGPLYLHLDLDVVNPDQLPGLRFPAPGGPGWSAVAEALGRVVGTGRVVALGVGCTPPGDDIQGGRIVDLKLELVLIPVSDVDRAKSFYVEKLGFSLDVDHRPSDEFRVVQMTPPGSACSISVGKGITDAAPGSVKGTHLVVRDIEIARDRLRDRGVDVSEIRHLESDGWVPGPDPERRDYGSFADFSDPDGNTWVLQERGRGGA